MKLLLPPICRTLGWACLVSLLLAGCTRNRVRIGVMGYGAEGRALQALLAQYGMQAVLDSSHIGSGANAHALLRGDIDLALIQNDVALQPEPSDRVAPADLRTVATAFPLVLHLLYRAELSAEDLRELVPGRRLGVGTRGSGTALLMQRLLAHYGIDSTEYTTVYGTNGQLELDRDIDIRAAMEPLYGDLATHLLYSRRAKLLSLDDPAWDGAGSSVEGFCQANPLAQPFRIARFAYLEYPDEPVLTLQVDAVLVSRSDLPDDLAYRIAEALEGNRTSLAQHSASFAAPGQSTLAEGGYQFPLHAGTRQYLARDRPSFWQQNAEVIALLITVASLFYAGVRTLGSRRQQVALNRIEAYYAEVLQLDSQADTCQTVGECQGLLAELQDIRRRAAAELQAERLLANESFSILLRLYDQARNRLEARARLLAGA